MRPGLTTVPVALALLTTAVPLAGEAPAGGVEDRVSVLPNTPTLCAYGGAFSDGPPCSAGYEGLVSVHRALGQAVLLLLPDGSVQIVEAQWYCTRQTGAYGPGTGFRYHFILAQYRTGDGRAVGLVWYWVEWDNGSSVTSTCSTQAYATGLPILPDAGHDLGCPAGAPPAPPVLPL